MAKWKRSVVGSILKGKLQPDGTTSPDYLQLKGGQYVAPLVEALKKLGDNDRLSMNLESKAFQLKDLQEGVTSGRVGEQLEEQIKTRIEKMPDFVRFEIVLLQKL